MNVKQLGLMNSLHPYLGFPNVISLKGEANIGTLMNMHLHTNINSFKDNSKKTRAHFKSPVFSLAYFRVLLSFV